MDAEVFKHSYIPRTLNEVVDVERDLRHAKEGRTDEVHTGIHCVHTHA